MFPRLRDLGYLPRYQKERFRKMFEYEQKDAQLWPALARFAALESNVEPTTTPVVAVALVRHWQVIPAPGVPASPYKAAQFYQAQFAPGSVLP